MGKKERGNSKKEKQKKRAKKTKIKIESTTKKEDGGRRIKSDANPSNDPVEELPACDCDSVHFEL